MPRGGGRVRRGRDLLGHERHLPDGPEANRCLPSVDRLVRPGTLSLPTLVARMSADPARLLNLPGGSLTAGAAADITVLDLDARVTVDPKQFRSRSRNTPFAGWEVVGAPVMTIVNGAVVKP